jgi:chemotaxis protein MotA
MFPIIGIVVVLGCIAGGYIMEKGNFLVLMQPAELLIILGAAIGTVLIGNPPHLLKAIAGGLVGVFKGSKYTQSLYLDTLKFLSDFFATSRKNGLTSLENDLDEPAKSELFKRHPKFATDLEVLHKQSKLPAGALTTMADSLPGLGIVAAVLGVVITMGSLGGPPEEIGHKVAAALVGTFLGILLCYGFLGPMAANMKKITESEGDYFLVLRMALLAYMKGMAPLLALEAARRAIPHHVRPTFQEMDKACKKQPSAPAAEAAA